ncbi:MAG TPA: XdhC family protein [Thermoflexales bacterium]|nr:XdhC family protein [Thermoflexales bacterium]
MRDLLNDIGDWQALSLPVAVATVIRTWGSAPRGAGAKMAVAEGNRISGSVSGGCIEGAVYEAGLEALGGGGPRTLHFGVADETAWEVGLACGGEIEVYVEALAPETESLWREAAHTGRGLGMAIVVGGPSEHIGRRAHLWADGKADNLDALPGLRSALEAALLRGGPIRSQVGPLDVFVDVILPPPSLICIGAAHIAIPLADMAATLGFRVTVIDPRSAFATPARFPRIGALINDWPTRALAEIPLTQATAFVALSHDPKIDDPALEIALRSQSFYVGVLGSARTHANRLERLRAAGFGEPDLARLHAPIGLDLGAHAPEEIALSILAEIVAVRNGLPGRH